MEQQVTQLVDQVRLLTNASTALQEARTQDQRTLIELQGRLLEQQRKRERIVLVDTRGISKPNVLKSEKEFGDWAFKLTNFLEGATQGFRKAMELAADKNAPIEAYGDLQEVLGEQNVDDMGNQLYTVLAQLTEGEGLALVQGVTHGAGWEAWRVLSRRYDPHGAARRRNVMGQLLQPGAYENKDLYAAVSRWEERARLYERRAGHPLPDDIKGAILIGMSKGSLKEHLELNAGKLNTYETIRQEIMAYLEGKMASQEPVPMDIGAFNTDKDSCKNCGKKGHWARDCRQPGGGGAQGGKKGGKGKGKGKGGKGKSGAKGKGKGGPATCNNCGRHGHQARDCWQPRGGGAGGAAHAANKNKGVGSLDENAKGSESQNTGQAPTKPEPETSLGSLTLDLCGLTKNSEEAELEINTVEHGRMFEATVDSGAAVCVMPAGWFAGTPAHVDPNCATGGGFRTASGQLIPDLGRKTVLIEDVHGERKRMTCHVAPVKKVLLAVSKLVDTGHSVHFTPDGAWVSHPMGRITPLARQNGVYVMKLRAHDVNTPEKKNAGSAAVKVLAAVDNKVGTMGFRQGDWP